MQVHAEPPPHYNGWYDSGAENTAPQDQDTDVTAPMYRLKMNSLLYNTESKPLCSVSNYVFDTNDNVLLDMDKHQIAMRSDEMPLNLSVSSFRPSVIQTSSATKPHTTTHDDTPTDVDEHFRRSLNGYYQRRRRSEQIRSSPLMSPPVPYSRARSPNHVMSLVTCFSNNNSLATAASSTSSSQRFSTAISSSSSSGKSSLKHTLLCPPTTSAASYRRETTTTTTTTRRRASCIPDVLRHVRAASPELPTCVVSLSESAAISVSGSVDDHFAKSLGTTWTDLKSTPSSSPDLVDIPMTTAKHHQPWLNLNNNNNQSESCIPDKRACPSNAVDTQLPAYGVSIVSDDDSIHEMETEEMEEQQQQQEEEEQEEEMKKEEEGGEENQETDTRDNNNSIDSVDEHFRKALGCRTWNLLTTKA